MTRGRVEVVDVLRPTCSLVPRAGESHGFGHRGRKNKGRTGLGLVGYNHLQLDPGTPNLQSLEQNENAELLVPRLLTISRG